MKQRLFWTASALAMLLAFPVLAEDSLSTDSQAADDRIEDFMGQPDEDTGEPQGVRLRSIDQEIAYVRWGAPLGILDAKINGASCSRPNRSDIVCFFPGVQWAADLGDMSPRFETALIFRNDKFFRFTVDFDPNITHPIVAAVQKALGEPDIKNPDSPGTRVYSWDKDETLTRVSEPGSLEVTYKRGEIVDAPPLVVPF